MENTSSPTKATQASAYSFVDEIFSSSQHSHHTPEKKKPQLSKKKVINISSESQPGLVEMNVHKQNQDSFFVQQSFMNNPLYYFIGVCDGHGVEGTNASTYITKNLPKNLNYALNNYLNPLNILNDQLKNLLINSFQGLNSQLIAQNDFDCTLSGTTCASAIITDDIIITCNVGDSRIVWGKYDETSCKFISEELTQDHKPDWEMEKARIEEAGGVVYAKQDELGKESGPMRIWTKDLNLPGWAMSRSFGDAMAAKVGVISCPEVKWFNWTVEDKFIIFASDGIWEYISNDECVRIVGQYYVKKDYEGAVQKLYRMAKTRWIKDECCIDDITVVVVYFE